MTRTHAVALLMVGFTALAVRLAYITLEIGWHSAPQFDGISYDLLARSLVSGNGYSLDHGATAFRAPGYPLFLAVLYILFGPSPAVARLADPILGAVLAAVTYVVGWSVLRHRGVAALAALIVALHPLLIYLSGRILSEALSAALVMLSIWLMVSCSEAVPLGKLVGLSLLLGVLILVRPAMLLFAILALTWLFAVSPSPKQAAKNAALFILVTTMCLVPWILRNLLEFGEFIPLATEGGVTFWGGNNALSTGGTVEPSPETWPEPDAPAGIQGWPGLGERESEGRFYAAALQWIRANPGRYAALLPRKLIRSWTLSFGNEARTSGLPKWVSYAYLLFPLLGAFGLVLSTRYSRRLLSVYLLILSSTATTLIFYGSARQSVILVPSLGILAAWAFYRLLSLSIMKARIPAS